MPDSIHEERMKMFGEAGLYLVTSEPLSRGRSTLAIVEGALRAGVRLIQLREKDIPLPRFLDLAEQVLRLTRPSGALLIINDRLDIALAAQADGVHLGQEDLPVDAARRIAPEMIIGASSHSEAEALAAQEAGASYVNIGPIFATNTKAWDREFLGLDGLRRISKVVHIPFTVMGGIKRSHIPHLVQAGARTIALVTAVTAAEHPEEAARELLMDIRRERGDA